MRVLAFASAAVLGAVIGPISALWGAGLLGGGAWSSSADMDVGGWRGDWSVGSEAANPYLRARIARYGLLAMRKEGAVYFVRDADDQGRQLTDACSYRLSGGGQDAYWWSITLYDGDSMLARNDDRAPSFDASDVSGDGAWEALIAAEAPSDGAWVSSRAAGEFDLTLRLYRPSDDVLSDPMAHVNAPSVERLSCGGAA
ncbi:MAG: DUF1214 domain-containing protein [Pseudomonadota bacterium]